MIEKWTDSYEDSSMVNMSEVFPAYELLKDIKNMKMKIELFSPEMKEDIAKVYYVRLKLLLSTEDWGDIAQILPGYDFKERDEFKDIYPLVKPKEDDIENYISGSVLSSLENYGYYFDLMNKRDSLTDFQKLTATSCKSSKSDLKFSQEIKSIIYILTSCKNTKFLKSITVDRLFNKTNISRLYVHPSVMSIFQESKKIFPHLGKEMKDVEETFRQYVISNFIIESKADLKDYMNFSLMYGNDITYKVIADQIYSNKAMGGYILNKDMLDKLSTANPEYAKNFEKLTDNYESLNVNDVYDNNNDNNLETISLFIPTIEKRKVGKKVSPQIIVNSIINFIKMNVSKDKEYNIFDLVIGSNVIKDPKNELPLYLVLVVNCNETMGLGKTDIISFIKKEVLYFIDNNYNLSINESNMYHSNISEKTESLVMNKRMNSVDTEAKVKIKKIKF
jgi:hypothetical protein